MPVLSLIERTFAALRGSSVLDEALAAWRSNNGDALSSFEDVEDVISFCRVAEPNLYAQKNEVVAALCREALRGDESAGLLLLWLFMPALWRIAEDLSREGCPLEREEIDAEILAGFWEQAGRGEPGSQGLSGRLVGAARFRALNAIRKTRREAGRRADLSGEEGEEPALVGHPSLVLEQARAAGVISEVDVELIAGTRLEHKALRGVAAELGLAHDNARVRRWRAEQRLVAWIAGRAG